MTHWLPAVEELVAHGGDWAVYEAALRATLDRDFVADAPKLDGKECRLCPPNDDRFWHLISSGPGPEAQRNTDLRRCERLCWVRPLIEAVALGKAKMWRAKRGRQTRVHVTLPDYSHLVVLTETRTMMLLMTAYGVAQPHRRRKLHKQWLADPDHKP